ncbi:MAG: hypothetical protein LH614_04115 [Pyrinomonadaceae bacterium]|nr:hypothetical protein [Pyrinomonadaceae bacterium]
MDDAEDLLIEKLITELQSSEKSIRFSRLLTICENVFGEYRTSGSHHIFKTPWQGDPRINLQKLKGNLAKPYQVRQVLQSLRKLKEVKKKNEQENR